MSDPSKDPTPKKRIVRSRVSASQEPAPAQTPALPEAAASPAEEPKARDGAASAALALAVMSARKEALSPAAPETPEVRPAAPSRAASLMRSPYAQAAALIVAVGAGWLGAEALTATRAGAQAGSAPWIETAQALRQGQQDVVRLTGDIKTLKVAIEALKESVDRSKTDLLAKQAQMMERVERAPGDGTARFAKLAEQLDRVEAAAKEPGTRLAALAERFDRLERQITTLQTAAAKPAGQAEAPAQTGTLPAQAASPEAKPAAKEPMKDVPIEGWTLHEVYDGVALIEGRNRRLYEVGLGGVLPGLGPVESIERRGKRWVVVTPKGFIGNER